MVEQLIINKILEDKSLAILDNYGLSKKHFLTTQKYIDFILMHFEKYAVVPDKVVFLNEFTDFDVLVVNESGEYLANKVKEAYMYKDLVPILKETSNIVRTDSIQAIEYLELQLEALKQANSFSPVIGYDIVANAKDREREYKKRCEVQGLLGISTGIKQLDDLTHGWLGGEDLITIFARTNMGKSWILLYFLEKAWEQGKKVLLYSGEMGRDIVGFRFDAYSSHFSNMGLMNGSKDLGEGVNSEHYAKHCDDLSKRSGFIVITPKDFKGKKPTSDDIKKLAVQYGADIIGIDQLTLMADKRKGENKRIQYTNITEDLFAVSEEIKKPIICVTQANRDSVKGKDKDVSPELHEIGESDGIAQNSSRVFSLVVLDGILRLSLKKNRYGLNNKDVMMLWNIDKGILKPMLEGGAKQVESYGF